MTNNDKTSHLPWIEKYRPSKLENIVLDDHINKQMSKIIENRELPNIIIEGPPGCGKTSLIKCLARKLYGKYYKDMVFEANPSDERGVSIHTSIDAFRRGYVNIAKEDKKIVPEYKLVILDEADNMTDKAKHMVSTFIENNISELRFAFTCNTKINIITSIQSRCLIIKFPKLNRKLIMSRLELICKFEGIIIDKDHNKLFNIKAYDSLKNTPKTKIEEIRKGLDAISNICVGDLRNGINILQLTYNRFKDVTEDNVYQIYDKPHPEKSKDLIVSCIKKDIASALTQIIDMKKMGYSGTDIALGLSLVLRMKLCKDVPEDIKIKFLEKISYSMYNISQGVDTQLQLASCIADLCSD